jgi:hypothetical protein
LTMQRHFSRLQSIFTDKNNIHYFLIFSHKHTKQSNLPHDKLLQTAFAIIRHLKPRKFKDVHLNKSPKSAPNNIIESHDSLFLK